MWQQYDKAVKVVLDYLVERGFRRTPRKEFHRAAWEFRRYLESIPREYSHTAAQSWLEAVKPSVPRLRYLSLRRSLALVDEAVRNGLVTNTRFTYDDAPFKYRVPGCYKQLLEAYIERRKQDGCQRSTLCMASNACRRFLLFLQSRNITEVALISPEVVKDYQAQAEHRTVEGKNAYICAVRQFVRFLAAKSWCPRLSSSPSRPRRLPEAPSSPPCRSNRPNPSGSSLRGAARLRS